MWNVFAGSHTEQCWRCSNCNMTFAMEKWLIILWKMFYEEKRAWIFTLSNASILVQINKRTCCKSAVVSLSNFKTYGNIPTDKAWCHKQQIVAFWSGQKNQFKKESQWWWQQLHSSTMWELQSNPSATPKSAFLLRRHVSDCQLREISETGVS